MSRDHLRPGEMYLGENNDVLDLIDRLRSQGINHYVDLPQIIVCGDQSSGKSSVLEAISGIQFPRKDNLCTRFATEVILRRAVIESSNAAIMPANDRAEDDRERIARFQRTGFDLESVESLVGEAREVMGIDGDARAFSNDVLRIELCGPQQPHLTLVDLPGLFSASNKAQSEGDADAVKSLVWSYMRNPRSIILAVVSAKNDFANQIVTKYTRDLDPEGKRTLGLITKPDTLHAGSESERSYVTLAKNEDVHFRLGWHVLRNRDFDTREASADERDRMEREFFATGLWTELGQGQVGIHTLRPRLSRLLRQQILIELPNLIADVEEGLDECRRNLSHMGTARATTGEQRLYLLQISQDFSFLTRSAVEGSYSDSFFGSAATREGYRKRLRAVVQNTSLDFAAMMRERGHAKHIVDTVTKNQAKMNPRLISKDNYIDEILVLMSRSRGRELPGTYNPQIVGDLFSEQSKPWQALVHSFVIGVWDATQATLGLILSHVADHNTATSLQSKIVQPALDTLKDSLDEAIAVVLHQTVHGHPITYNHYLTEDIQKLRAERQTALLSHKLDQFFGTNTALGKTYCGNKTFDVKSLLQTLTQGTIADMDRYACSEAADVMKAYYEIALKTCIDGVAHTIERALLRQLPSLLSPQTTMTLDDTTVNRIAAETDDVQQERTRFVRKQKLLKVASSALRALNQSRTSDEGLTQRALEMDKDGGTEHSSQVSTGSDEGEWPSDGFGSHKLTDLPELEDDPRYQNSTTLPQPGPELAPDSAWEPEEVAQAPEPSQPSVDVSWDVPIRSLEHGWTKGLAKPSNNSKKKGK